LKRIGNLIVFAIAIVYFLLDAIFATIAIPLSRWIAAHWALARIHRWVLSLRPYPTLLLFVIPLIVLEPAKPVAAYLVGTGHAVLGLGILALRGFLPESPRWLMIHGREAEADKVVRQIEDRVKESTGSLPPIPPERFRFRPREHAGLGEVAAALFRAYPRRAVLGLALMGAQAFLYNAIFFTYALVLGRFFQVPPGEVGLYLLPFSITNAVGPMLLGPLFDTWGRKPMIAATYAISGLVLLAGGWMFAQGQLNAMTLTAVFSVVFFFASPAASAAYLTVGESFPLETRAMAIAIFYALGTAVGGVAGPLVFGHLIGAGGRDPLFHGYLFAAALMIGAALVELAIGIKSERRSLESVAAPLASAE